MQAVRTSRAEWLDRVRDWKAGGLSRREYASSAGINPSTLSWWKWKLSREGEDLTPNRRKAKRSLPASFVELELPEPAEPETSRRPDPAIELVCRETIIRLPAGFDGSRLEGVLDLLEARR